MDTNLKNNKAKRVRVWLGIFVAAIVALIGIFVSPYYQRAYENLLAQNQSEANEGGAQNHFYTEDLSNILAYKMVNGSYTLYSEKYLDIAGNEARSLYYAFVNDAGLYEAYGEDKQGLTEEEESISEDILAAFTEYDDIILYMRDEFYGEDYVDYFIGLTAFTDDIEESDKAKNLSLASGDAETDKNIIEVETKENTYIAKGTNIISVDLSAFYSGSEEDKESLKASYAILCALSFDENGSMSVKEIYSAYGNEDEIYTYFSEAYMTSNFKELMNTYGEYELFHNIENTDIVFGVKNNSALLEFVSEYNEIYDYDLRPEVAMLYFGSLLAIFIMGLIFTLMKRSAEGNVLATNKKYVILKHPFEIALILGIGILLFFEPYYEVYKTLLIEQCHLDWTGIFFGAELDASGKNILFLSLYVLMIFAELCLWLMVSVEFWKVGLSGLGRYFKERSWGYQIFPAVKKLFIKLKKGITHMDLSEKNTIFVIGFLGANFLIIAFFCLLGGVGILAAAVYSAFLFFIIMKILADIREYYNRLRDDSSRIVKGDFTNMEEGEYGMFKPIHDDLSKIQEGFKKAVQEEVKSERMKTDLITNVSHDLKTPLTAITTYVELLKNPELSKEDREKYIDILDRKSLRLKALIEDLFEVSKATSDNLNLDIQDIDLCKLVKQVAIENEEKIIGARLDFKFDLPEEPVVLKLDSGKTYRIFENLYTNALKYALTGTRVYVSVEETSDLSRLPFGKAELQKDNEDTGINALRNGTNRDKSGKYAIVCISNISATELNFKEDEITERFVRGDISRNTDGHGLGLAIVKSFAKAMGGELKIKVDGDLFKAYLIWEK